MRLFFLVLLLPGLSLASKARIQALSGSFHLLDTQNVFRNPLDLNYLDNFVSIETGVTASTGMNDNAEGMLSYTWEENRHLAVVLGHQDAAVTPARSFINAVTGYSFDLPQNPLHLIYGFRDSMTSYAIGFLHSAKDDKVANTGESSDGFIAGYEIGSFQISAIYSWLNKAQVAGHDMNAPLFLQLRTSFLLDESMVEAVASRSDIRVSTGGVEEENHSIEFLSLGLVDSKIREENDFFWGAQINSVKVSCKMKAAAVCDKNLSQTILPVWFGFEAQANDWLTLRASVKQSLFSTFKDEVGYPSGAVLGASGTASDLAGGPNSTGIAVGAGINFKDFTLDGVFSAGTTQTLNSSSFLTQVGITYRY